MPQGLDDLSHVRRQFRANLVSPSERSRLPTLDADRIEECVLALDELLSNGLRHGRAPVQVEVCAAEDGLLILVQDRDTAHPPQPTSTRDPAEGGMGLSMVAHVSLACGWTTSEDCKTVWCLMPSASTPDLVTLPPVGPGHRAGLAD